jgi:hypothetical protein
MGSPIEKAIGGVPIEMKRMLQTESGDLLEEFSRLSSKAQKMVLESMASMKEQARRNPRELIEALPVIIKFCGDMVGNQMPENTRPVPPSEYDSQAEASARIEAFINEQERRLRATGANGPHKSSVAN